MLPRVPVDGRFPEAELFLGLRPFQDEEEIRHELRSWDADHDVARLAG